MISIEWAVPEDKDAIMALFRTERKMWEDPGSTWWRYWNGGPARTEHWDKAVLGGKIVGFCHWRFRSDNARSVDDMIVAPEMRRKGIGRALIEAVGTPINLKTDEHSPSNGFYQSLGFIQGATTVAIRTNKRLVNYSLPKEKIVVGTAPWIMTYTGKKINPLKLRPEDICIEDIAHGQACTNRWAGQSCKPISSAQHSVWVSHVANQNKTTMFQALLHDATDAYFPEVPIWLKQSPEMKVFLDAEHEAERMIFRLHGLPEEMLPEVARADRVMAMYEGQQGFGLAWDEDHLDRARYPPITPEELEKIEPWAPLPWRAAEQAFLLRYRACRRM